MCCSSVFAWDAESFTNGSVYAYEPVMTMGLDDGINLLSDVDSLGSISVWDFCSNFPVTNYGLVSYYLDHVSTPIDLDLDYYPLSYMSGTISQSSGIVPDDMSLSRQVIGNVVIPSYPDGEFQYVLGFLSVMLFPGLHTIFFQVLFLIPLI